MTKKPVIGVTLDYEEKDTYANVPWYALRENYIGSVVRAGGTPLLLPHEPECVPHYMEIIDGLIVTGGHFDVHPKYYGDDDVHDEVILKEKRTTFEFAAMKHAIEHNMPILGICGGQQLLNVVLGGTLIQHIPDYMPSAHDHEKAKPRAEVSHPIDITPDTLFHKVAGVTNYGVNSTHHQAVLDVGEGVVVNAKAPDGIIEGIEYTNHPFCIGVQWHPEHELHEADSRLFQHLVQACQNQKQ